MGTFRHFAKVGQGLHLNLKLAKTEMTLAHAAFMSYGKKQTTFLKSYFKNTVQLMKTALKPGVFVDWSLTLWRAEISYDHQEHYFNHIQENYAKKTKKIIIYFAEILV